MITVIDHMPPGTVGVRAHGKVTEADYRDVLVPAVTAAQQDGRLRLLYVLDDGFDYSAGAMWADAKLWAKTVKGWERLAVVADADWLEHAGKAMSWMISGEVKVFESDELREAKIWLVGIDD